MSLMDMKSCTKYENMFFCCYASGIKIKNPPADFESKAWIKSSQYTVVQ